MCCFFKFLYAWLLAIGNSSHSTTSTTLYGKKDYFTVHNFLVQTSLTSKNSETPIYQEHLTFWISVIILVASNAHRVCFHPNIYRNNDLTVPCNKPTRGHGHNGSKRGHGHNGSKRGHGHNGSKVQIFCSIL